MGKIFFIKNRIQCGDITVRHCPAEPISMDLRQALAGGSIRDDAEHVQGIEDDGKGRRMSWE